MSLTNFYQAQIAIKLVGHSAFLANLSEELQPSDEHSSLLPKMISYRGKKFIIVVPYETYFCREALLKEKA
jgi:hypothetical protein